MKPLNMVNVGCKMVLGVDMLLFLMFLLVGCVKSTSSILYWDYVVVGAGPAGLQMGFLLERAHRDYVVLERGNVSGNFFTRYPRHDRLISINKRFTGKSNKEFNLRHDWNSLISDDESLLMTQYSEQFFPPKQDLVRYLNDYQQKLGINTRYNADVQNIRRERNASTEDHQFIMNDGKGNTYMCKTLIIATGIATPNIPDIDGLEYTEGYEKMSLNPKDYEGQSVLILGRGNTAFEVADSIMGSTNLIHMVSRSRVRLAWATHYVGDLRAVNNGLLDTYQLKSQDGVLEAPLEEVRIIKQKGKYQIALLDKTKKTPDMYDNFSMRESYDKIIRCLGFRFDKSIFHNSTDVKMGSGRRKKYPRINYDYQSRDVPGLYFAGTVTHSLDFRKSAGGFIHGFRYTTRCTHHILEWRNHGVKWPASHGPVTDLVNVIVKRINEASGIYQMFSVLCDIVLFKNGGSEYVYIEEFPVNLVHRLWENSGHEAGPAIIFLFEYGEDFSGPGKDIFRLDRATGDPAEAHLSNFLHPVFFFYKDLPRGMNIKDHEAFTLPRPDRLHHTVEDFLTNWEAPTSHILPLRRFIETVINEDLRQFFAEDCMKMVLTFQNIPRTCREYFLQGEGILGTEELLVQAAKAGLML